MRVLVTSSRMPFAITEIRALGRMGHHVHTADTFGQAPGSHSNVVVSTHETVSPRHDPVRYVQQIDAIVDEHAIDLVLPTFEEVFYLARQGSRVGGRGASLFAASFEALERLHNKVTFVELMDRLDLPVPETVVCRTRDELGDAVHHFGHFFARAAFSRAGTSLFSGSVSGDDNPVPDNAQPSFDAPWIVQRYVEGIDLSSFSVVRHGRVIAHSTYRHPKNLEGSGGIVFESLEDPRTLDAAQRIAAATDYHGQLSLDFLDSKAGTLYLVECNPRPTAGVAVMPPEMFVDAVVGERDGSEPLVAPAGIRRNIRSALLRDLIRHPSQAWSDLLEIFSDASDLYFDKRDPWPAIYQFLSLSHVVRYWHSSEGRLGAGLAESYLHDVTWNGQPIPSVPQRILAPPPPASS